jgi:Xaa-Pro aminopeptidase
MSEPMSSETTKGLCALRDVYSYDETPLQRVTEWLATSALAHVVLTGPEWVRWLAGYACYGVFPAAVVVRSNDVPVVIVSGLELDAARSVSGAKDFVFAPYGDVGFGLLADPMAAIASTYATLDLGSRAPVGHVDSAWLAAVQVASSELCNVSGAIGDIRMVKSSDEIEEIARRVALVWVAERAIADALEGGASEIDLFSLARSAMERSWGSPIEMTADVVGGPNGSGIGAPVDVPGRRVVEVGEALIADIAIIASGYGADLTWTHIRGVNAELQDLRDRLIDVRTTIVAGLVPGRACSDVYREMISEVDKAAPGHTFAHHGGHGIGLAFYEAPFFTPWCDTALREGMTVAVEPGAYGQGHGVRVENNYLVTSIGGIEIPGRPSDMGRHSRD